MVSSDRSNPFSATAPKAAGKLAENILYFARALRDTGLPVGPGSVIDAIQAVEAAGIGTREDFYETLHAVFVKKHEHSVIFQSAFQIFWRKRGFLEKLIAMMSPTAVDRSEPKKPDAGAARVADALYKNPREEKPREQVERIAQRAAQIAARKPPRLIVEADGREREGSFVLIGNGRFYGGPVAVFKDARIDDGLLDVLIFKNLGYLDIARYLGTIFMGNHTELADVEYFQTPRAAVRSEEDVPVEVDGELIAQLPITFRISSRKLRVVVPGVG